MMRIEMTESFLVKDLVSTVADIVFAVAFIHVMGCAEISAAEALSKKQ